MFNPINLAALADAPRKKYSHPDQYFEELGLWLQQAYFWQNVTSGFPYYLMCRQPPPPQPNARVTSPQPTTPFPQQPPPQIPNQTAATNPTQFVDTSSQDGIHCRIPAFWKRIVAEIIDFLVLFFLKLGVTYIAIDVFDIIDWEKFYLFQKEPKLEYKALMKLTEEIFVLELVLRVIVCLYETWWLAGGGGEGRIGGASPGKSFMGLRVVRCESVTTPTAPWVPLQLQTPGENAVIIKPGSDLGISLSFVRSAIKNFILAAFIPTSFGALLYFPYNRTGYDMICGSIVVEEPIIILRQRRAQPAQ